MKGLRCNAFTSVLALVASMGALAPTLAQPSDASHALIPSARLGSRFNLFIRPGLGCVYSGGLGADFDQPYEFYIGFKTGQGRFTLPLHHQPGEVYILTQQKPLLLSATNFGLETSEANYSGRIISPHSTCASLQDSVALRAQIAPGFIIELTIAAKQTVQADFLCGLAGTPLDPIKQVGYSFWRYGKPTKELAFTWPHETTFSIASPDSGRHFNEGVVHGLVKSIKVEKGRKATVYFFLSAHCKAPPLRYQPGGSPYAYFYHRFFSNVSAVNAYLSENYQRLIGASDRLDAYIVKSSVDTGMASLIALALRSDETNAFLVDDVAHQPSYFLTEGRFRHLNTVDVAVEAELSAYFNPWRLKLQLEQWASAHTFHEELVYSNLYHPDQPTREGGSAAEIGPLIYHDVGNAPYVFNKEGYDFGPYMPVEQNTSFVLLLEWYYNLTHDTAFIKRHASLAYVLMQSCMDRDANGNGIADNGMGWTTFDVSETLKRSADNIYLGLKQAAAYGALARLLPLTVVMANAATSTYKSTSADGQSTDANKRVVAELATISNGYLRARQCKALRREADLIKKTVLGLAKKRGYLPLALGPEQRGSESSALLADGFMLPAVAGTLSSTEKQLLDVLYPQLAKAKTTSVKSYGISLTTLEACTWFSKTMASDVLFSALGKPSWAAYKAALAWNITNDQAYQDGAYSSSEPWPGNWYPRGVASLGYLLRPTDLPAATGWKKHGIN